MAGSDVNARLRDARALLYEALLYQALLLQALLYQALLYKEAWST